MPSNQYALIVVGIREAGGSVEDSPEEHTRPLEDIGLDSLMLMDAIESIQQKCQVTFHPQDFTPDRFATIHDIAALVQERSQSGQGGETPPTPNGGSER